MKKPPEQPSQASVARELQRYLLWHQSQGTEALLQSAASAPVPATVSPASVSSAPVSPAPVSPASAPPASAPPAPVPAQQAVCAGPSESPPPSAAHVSLEEIRAQMGDCRLCKLCKHRTQIVFGAGNPKAELVFVGEGPGADEDAQGIPFVGRAGQLLTKMVEAMHFSRDEVYICNVVKCRPPDNRNPEPDEIKACSPFLKAQLASIRPKVLVALGKFAVHTLLSESTPITKLRGRWREYEGIPLMPTFHPAYLLRNPVEKKNAWLDLQSVMQRLGKPLK